MEIVKLKTYIQSANVNFLFGSGLSKPYLETLGDIEKRLTELSASGIDDDVCNIIKASIYKEYFTKVILPNFNPDERDADYKSVIDNYRSFLSLWNDIFNKRHSRLLSKQLNIYTTNIDTLVENAAEETTVEFNDGFKGSINQIFDEGNFQKSYSKTSLHFQNVSELPVFNLLKMHGSINWVEKENTIYNDYSLQLVKVISEKLNEIGREHFVAFEEFATMKANAVTLQTSNPKTDYPSIYKDFFEIYDKLIIVNPTKRKFSETVMDIHFYELMRLYSNSLEKEQSILFVMGFSFADEHIRKITLRAANTNPTLLVVVFAYDDDQKFEFENNICNNNVFVLTPSKFKERNKADEKETTKELLKSLEHFNMETINKVFSLINNDISINYGK